MTLIIGKQHEKRPQDSWQCQPLLSRLVLSKKARPFAISAEYSICGGPYSQHFIFFTSYEWAK